MLMVDFQSRLLPAITNAEQVVQNAARLVRAAELLNVPLVFTEQNPRGIGSTVATLLGQRVPVPKINFNACHEPELLGALAGRSEVVIAGCEAHVCVLQTTFGLLRKGHSVYVVQDALGARLTANKDVAIGRMMRAGAEIVTTEMVIFEWLERSDHPRFREVITLIK
jgi:nicotinamidase-related amidase